jgi:tetratricopeptide (TPR) repeat protein
MVDLVRSLRREKIVRRIPGSDVWYIASDELDRIPASPNKQWYASREMETLPPELAELVKICVVLGLECSLKEVDAIQANANSGNSLVVADPSIGLERLVERRFLKHLGAEEFAFREASFQEGVYGLLSDDYKQHIHRLALQYWSYESMLADHGQLHRIAHHAERGDVPERAITSYVAMGSAAASRNSHREAEAMYTAALELMEKQEKTNRALRRRVLNERAWSRRNLTQYEDALSDLKVARALAEELADYEALVEVLVSEASVHDFLNDFAKSAELLALARERASGGVSPRVEARLLNWSAVSLYRARKFVEAIDGFNAALVLARTIGDVDTEAASHLLLALALSEVGHKDAAMHVLDRCISMCEQRGDYWHLVVGLNNRVEFWRDRKDIEAARKDIERAVQIAFDCGYFWIEVYGHVNLAELYLMMGDTDAALKSAEIAYRRNMVRFREKPIAIANLYYAQLLAHVGRLEESHRILLETPIDNLGEPIFEIVARCVRASTSAADDRTWDEIIELARRMTHPEHVTTIIWLRGLSAGHVGDDARAARHLRAALELAREQGSGMIASIERDLNASEQLLALADDRQAR